MAKDDLTTTGGSTASPDGGPLVAHRITIEVSYDMPNSQVKVTSWSLDDFELTGRDLFELLAQVPAEIEAWFNKHLGVEVLVMPLRPSLRYDKPSLESGYVAVPIRPLAAALRNMEPKP